VKSVNINEIKNKFGYLLSFLHLQCELDSDSISNVIVESNYFDFLENNDVESFLSKDIVTISKNVFRASQKKYSPNYLNDYVYAGECYISISISLCIPLRKLFLIYPLSKMLSLYPLYHEVAQFRVIEKVKNDISTKTAFSILLEKSEYSVLSVSKICDINRNYLSSLLKEAKQEDKLTYLQISKLSDLFGVDKIFFTSSNFVPYYSSLWNEYQFVIFVIKHLSSICENKHVYFDFDGNRLEANKNKTYIVISPDEAYLYKKNNRSKIPNSKFDLAIKLSLIEYREYCLNKNIAFC